MVLQLVLILLVVVVDQVVYLLLHARLVLDPILHLADGGRLEHANEKLHIDKVDSDREAAAALAEADLFAEIEFVEVIQELLLLWFRFAWAKESYDYLPELRQTRTCFGGMPPEETS